MLSKKVYLKADRFLGLLLSRNLDLKRAASAIGIGYSTLHNLVNQVNGASLNSRVKIVNFFQSNGVSADDLFTRDKAEIFKEGSVAGV